ncbi:MFS transporter [Terricaulis sp.]|uniref:MFS transporter n=1 Tax=Terricaulis sp. TaxID=2768686 RepID=UPI0037840EE6
MQGSDRGSPAAGTSDAGLARPALFTTLAVLSGYMAPAMIYDALPPILPRIAEHFGGGQAGEWVAQMSVGLAILGTGFGGLVAGAAVARLGLRTTLIAGWLLFAAFGSLGFVLDDARLLLVSRFATGLGAGMLLGACTVAIGISYGERARPRMTGFGLATAAGSAVIFLYVAAMAAEASWRAPFAVHAILALVTVPLALFARFPPVQPAVKFSLAELATAARRLAPAYALILVLVLVGNLFIVQTTFLLNSRGFSDPDLIARILVISPAVIGVANLSFGALEARIGLNACVVAALGCFALGAGCYGASSTLALTALGVGVGSLGVGIGVPAAFVSAMNGCDERTAPHGIGLATALNCFAGFLAPTIYVPLYHSIGYDATYLGIGALMVAFAFLYLVGSRARSAPVPGGAQ